MGTVGAAGLAGTLGVLAKPAIVRSAGLQRVRLGWAQPVACHAPLAYAAKIGVFAKYGVDVDLVDFLANGDDAQVLRAVRRARGTVEMGFIAARTRSG
jgi:NitT/TauT family transport system substrate-binding protein